MGRSTELFLLLLLLFELTNRRRGNGDTKNIQNTTPLQTTSVGRSPQLNPWHKPLRGRIMRCGGYDYLCTTYNVCNAFTSQTHKDTWMFGWTHAIWNRIGCRFIMYIISVTICVCVGKASAGNGTVNWSYAQRTPKNMGTQYTYSQRPGLIGASAFLKLVYKIHVFVQPPVIR